LSRNTDRWRDDDDRPGRPQRSSDGGGLSPVAIILLVLGGVFVVGVVGCGGLMWLGYRKAQDREQQAIAAAEAERAEEQRVRDNIARIGGANADPFPNVPNPFGDPPVADEPPPPRPGFEPAAEPPPQPKPTAFATDDPKNPTRWRVLFRSNRPELWNTNTQTGDDFAIPLRSTPADTRYLRLRRMDTGEAIIIPMSRGRIGRVDPPGRKARWNGEGKDDFGGYHLGIAEGAVARFMEGQGTIGVLMDGWDANPGSGFGHAHHIENGGQRFSWRGKELSPTVFEVAVTTGELSGAERAWLRE
jgi:hypothetical protein